MNPKDPIRNPQSKDPQSAIRNPQSAIGQSAIDVDAIERELTSLWKQAGDEDEGVIRACLLNLLIFTPRSNGHGGMDDIVAEITAGHPCRALLILADRPAADAYLRAQVTSRCTLPTAGSKQVCCEQVTFEAGREQVNEVPSAVLPLLLSDLPVYLWWHAVPRLEDRVFKRLADASDRVIIDSAEFAKPNADLLSLASILRESPRWTAFSDLNWARLLAWRALLAGFYDVAQYRKSLDQLDTVVIEYAPPPSDTTAIAPRALLLAGWLASRLGWHLNHEATARADSSVSFEFQTRDRKLEVLLTPVQNPAIEPGRIALVRLFSAAGSATFNVRRSDDRSRIETEVNIGEDRKIQRVLSYENWGEGELIGRELEILGHDRVYEEAILAAGEMVAVSMEI